MYASLQKQNERGHALLSPRRSIRMNHTVSLYIRSFSEPSDRHTWPLHISSLGSLARTGEVG